MRAQYRLILGAAVSTLTAAQAWGAATYQTVDRLSSTSGWRPAASLVAGPDGRFYDTATTGAVQPDYTFLGNCSSGCGTVFALSPPTPDQPAWHDGLIYQFLGGNDGAAPSGEVVFGRNGEIYSTASTHGAAAAGTVFRLTPPSKLGGVWAFAVLHTLNGTTEGATPLAGLVIDGQGHLYGVASAGGVARAGTVFRLTPPAGSGGWTFDVLYRFAGPDGANPVGALIARSVDGVFTLFGTTKNGGQFGKGTVFSLAAPSANRSAWTHATLHDFTGGADGALPTAPLIADRSLHLYGTTTSGGTKIRPVDNRPYFYSPGYPTGAGVVFRLAPPSCLPGAWTENVLHSFQGFSDGAVPQGKLYESSRSVIFGVTREGGIGGDPEFVDCYECGLVFQLIPRSYGGSIAPWKNVTVHLFDSYLDDANFPVSGFTPTMSAKGVPLLLGIGGDNSIVYEVVP